MPPSVIASSVRALAVQPLDEHRLAAAAHARGAPSPWSRRAGARASASHRALVEARKDAASRPAARARRPGGRRPRREPGFDEVEPLQRAQHAVDRAAGLVDDLGELGRARLAPLDQRVDRPRTSSSTDAARRVDAAASPSGHARASRDQLPTTLSIGRNDVVDLGQHCSLELGRVRDRRVLRRHAHGRRAERVVDLVDRRGRRPRSRSCRRGRPR